MASTIRAYQLSGFKAYSGSCEPTHYDGGPYGRVHHGSIDGQFYGGTCDGFTGYTESDNLENTGFMLNMCSYQTTTTCYTYQSLSDLNAIRAHSL
jgi:hypothetical protein